MRAEVADRSGRMRFQALLLVTLVGAPLTRATGQTREERAFAALRASHIGSLTPLLTPAMLSRRPNGAQLGIRYGLRDEGGVRTQSVAGSALFAAGLQSSVIVTAGVLNADCTSCSPALVLGLGADMRVGEAGDVAGKGSLLTLAVSADVGYAQLKPANEDAVTLGVGLPVTLSIATNARGMRFAPFFTPVFGVGETSSPCPSLPIPSGMNCDKSGVRWVLGGGVGLWNPESGVAATVGVNQVVLAGAKPVFGINVILGGR